MNKIILEIGTEEIPSLYLDSLLKGLQESTKNLFEKYRLDCHNIRTMGTPRRLVMVAEDIASQQKDIFHKIKGPSIAISFDSDGRPKEPAIKFARTNNAKLDDLIIEKTDKGEYIFVKKQIKGEKLESLLPEIFMSLIAGINSPKSMRWGTSNIKFIRPIRWILALHNNKIVPLKLDILTSARKTYGHRLLAPGSVKIRNVDEYFEILKDRFVILDPLIRKNIILNQIKERIKNKNGIECIDQLLLDEVTNLVEYPKVLQGAFDKEYLNLPSEILIAVMVKHQKYFPVYGNDNVLLPFFLVVTNGNDDMYSDIILKGNERVLKARLEDAKFFFLEDQKIKEPGKKPLDEKLENLKKVIFQENSGTIFDKVNRLTILSNEIAQDLQLDNESKNILERSAHLCKSDLVTEMVKEFPDLQGIMGKEYAILQGERYEVANTIFEHYLPRFSGDIFPISLTGSILSIADKLDNISSCFLNNLVPDGSQDPYALRRQSLGIINISFQQNMYFSMDRIIKTNLELFERNVDLTNNNIIDIDSIVKNIKNFIFQRLRYLLLEKGYKYDIIDAVLAKKPEYINDVLDRIKAIKNIYNSDGFLRTITAATRAYNLSKNKENPKISPELFKEKEEYSLYESYLKVKNDVKNILSERNYDDFYKSIKIMNKPIDIFFDKILVMVEDETIRNNRLSILKEIADLYFLTADLNKISLSKNSIN